MTQTITNLAIMGMGRWGMQLVEAVQGKSRSVRFATVVSRNADRVRADADRLGLDICSDLNSVLAKGKVDGVVLATPHSTHEEQIIACARAGKPVFVEKPFTLTKASAERALAQASADLVVAVGHNRRFLPSVVDLKEMLDEGRLGRILYVESNFSGNVASAYKGDHWRVRGGESPAGGLAGAGIHMIDLIIHLCAPIQSVYAESRRQFLDIQMDDTTYATFKLEGGAGAFLTTLMATAPTFRLQVFGTNGTAELSGENCLVLTDLSGKREVRDYDPVDTRRIQLEAFGAAIRGGAGAAISRDDILNGVAAFEAVGLSAARGEQVDI
ncbi:MAG: Gfo/Idh/MocA family oxidoreductase [Rhizobiaceae bacterium]|nr:Gfo/Idh/MocA family oxidoreductase [Rhizobiaceae bacterium]